MRQVDQSRGAPAATLPKLGDMVTRRRSHLPTCALLGALLGASVTAWPWPAEAHRAPALCTSTREPTLAARLSRDITKALKGRESTVSLAVHDPGRGLRCRLADTDAYDSASIAKVLIMQAVLGRAEELGRAPTRLEARRLKAMITRSDNTAASELWKGLSRARLKRVLREAGARDTVLGHDSYWGLTRTTARDQLALLAAISRRTEALSLMGQVVRQQAWGVSAGAPRTVKVHLKNGWLPRKTHAWRVHSVGIVRPAATTTGAGASASMGMGMGTGPGVSTGTGPGVSTGTGPGVSPGPGPGTSTGTSTGASNGTGPGSGTGPGTGTGLGTGTGPGPSPSAGTSMGASSGPGPGASTGPGIRADTGTDTGADTGTGGPAVDYRIVLLSHDNPTLRYGVRTLESISLVVHRRLSGGAAAREFTPPEKIGETPDGSAPAEAPGRVPRGPGDPGAPGGDPAPGSSGPAVIRGAVPPSRTARARRRAPRRRRSRPSE